MLQPPSYHPERAILTKNFKKWYKKRDENIKRVLRNVLKKIGALETRQVKWIEDKLWELKLNSHRVYFGAKGEMIYLLDGGTKSLQDHDLDEVRGKWKEIRGQ